MISRQRPLPNWKLEGGFVSQLHLTMTGEIKIDIPDGSIVIRPSPPTNSSALIAVIGQIINTFCRFCKYVIILTLLATWEAGCGWESHLNARKLVCIDRPNGGMDFNWLDFLIDLRSCELLALLHFLSLICTFMHMLHNWAKSILEISGMQSFIKLYWEF